MASGQKGTIRIGAESTWGTAATTLDGMEALSESLALTKDRYAVKNITGTVAEADDFAGLDRIAGDLVVPAYPYYVGKFWKGVFATSAPSSAAIFTHTYNTQVTDFSTDTPFTPYTIEVFRDVTSSDRYRGCAITALTLDLRPNQELRMTASFVGKDTVTVANTAPSFPTSPLQPFAFDTASLALAGSGTAQIETLTLRIDNQLDAIAALNAASTVAKLRRRGSQMIGLSGTIDFADRTEYAKFVQQSEQAFSLYLTRAASFALLIDLPRVVYTAFAPVIAGPERITVPFEGKARYASSGTFSGTAMRTALTTTNTTFN